MRRFIYLDTDTLNSYIAQIYDGLVQSNQKETQAETTDNKQSEYSVNVEGGVEAKILGKGIEGKIDGAFDYLKGTSNTELIKDVQTKLLHDNAFNQFMSYLEDNDCFSGNKIGDFVEIEDDFYVLDLEYLRKIMDSKRFINFMKETDKNSIRENLKELQELEKAEENANSNAINQKYKQLEKQQTQESDRTYDDMKENIEMLSDIIPYRRVMCVGNNMIVLNDKYMRDNVDMTSMKYGGKIKIVGYITNKVSDDENVDKFGPLHQLGVIINQTMKLFFGSQSELNIIHPIAIYYE